MVRALLAGTKAQTRRALRNQPSTNTVQVSTWHHPDPRPMFYAWTRNGAAVADHPTAGAEISDWLPGPCPYGQPGDRLWVRETWRIVGDSDDDTLDMFDCDDVQYRADDDQSYIDKYRPSIYMPRRLSRITLEVTGVRVERLQDISEADALAEGVAAKHTPDADYTAREAYAALWEQINGGGSWAANPWVWVVEFKRAGGGAA